MAAATATGSAATCPLDGSVTFTDVTSAWCTLGVWGPMAEATLTGLVTERHGRADQPLDLSAAGFPYGSVREVLVDGLPAVMFRISYVGENGWEIYTPTEHGLALWDAVFDAGEPHGIVPVGIGVYAVTGRIEKGYRLMGAELESEYDPVEAGLARPKVKSADFIGKEAYLAAREHEPAATLCTLEMVDHRDSAGVDRFPTGGNEPIVTPDGERIVDAKGRVSQGDDRRRRAVARHLPADGVPPAGARRRGHRAARQVHGRAVPRARVGSQRVRPRHPHEFVSRTCTPPHEAALTVNVRSWSASSGCRRRARGST